MRFFEYCFCLSALLFTAVTAAQIRPADILKIDVPETGVKLSYGPDPLQFGELRLPLNPSLSLTHLYPVLIIVHGGCWSDRLPGMDPEITTYRLTRPLAADLTSAGMATWNIEYRRAGSPGGGWPNTFLDLAAATDYIRKIAPSYHLDPERVIVIGHSSGGQFALWIAARPKIAASSPLYTRNPLPVQMVIDLDGPPDPAAAQPVERNFCPVSGITKLLGGTPAQQPQRYHDASAQSFLPLGVPQQIYTAGLLQGSPDLVASYEAAAKARGEDVHDWDLASGHFDLLNPASQAGENLKSRLTDAWMNLQKPPAPKAAGSSQSAPR